MSIFQTSKSFFQWKWNIQQFSRLARNYSTSKAKVIKMISEGSLANTKVVEEDLPSVGPGQVLVEMLAAPVHPGDVNFGGSPFGYGRKYPLVGGSEGMGVVKEIGSSVKNLKLNDEVILCNLNLGSWRSHGVFNETDLLKLSFRKDPNVRPEYSASFLVAPMTAYRVLHDFVKLSPGDTVLLNGANSSFGYAAVQIACELGLKTICVVRERHDYDTFVERFKLFGAYIVVSDKYVKTHAFERLISDLPKPKLAINTVGGSTATHIAKHLADGGTFVTIGGMSGKGVTVPSSLLIYKNIKMKGFWLHRWLEQTSHEKKQETLDQIIRIFERKKLFPWVETFPMSRFNLAIERYNEPQKSRKVMLTSDSLQPIDEYIADMRQRHKEELIEESRSIINKDIRPKTISEEEKKEKYDKILELFRQLNSKKLLTDAEKKKIMDEIQALNEELQPVFRDEEDIFEHPEEETEKLYEDIYKYYKQKCAQEGGPSLHASIEAEFNRIEQEIEQTMHMRDQKRLARAISRIDGRDSYFLKDF